MTLPLPDQIKKLMKKKNLNASQVEKLGGLGLNAVYNIIRGVSKNPKLHTLRVIADVLECSMDDLLDREGYTSSPPSSKKGDKTSVLLPFNDFELFLKACEIVVHVTKEKKYEITLEQATNLIMGIYSFSVKKKVNTIDTSFVEWLFETTISS